jgi:hypothetical protein
MNYEIEHQDRAWRRLNVRREARFWEILSIIEVAVGISAFACFGSLAIYWWSK